jgi:hypothetical protein
MDSTHLETDTHRYIFIPFESLYLLVIQFNVIEDIEILMMIYRLQQDLCENITKDSVLDNAFELSLGIDDCYGKPRRNGVQKTAGAVAKKKQIMNRMEEIEKQRRENKYISDSM